MRAQEEPLGMEGVPGLLGLSLGPFKGSDKPSSERENPRVHRAAQQSKGLLRPQWRGRSPRSDSDHDDPVAMSAIPAIGCKILRCPPLMQTQVAQVSQRGGALHRIQL